MNEINKIIGDRVKEARSKKKWSREMLARRIGVSQQQIERYEKGANSIPVANLRLIAKALGKEIIYFLQTIEDIH